jgi:hypothetical protein
LAYISFNTSRLSAGAWGARRHALHADKFADPIEKVRADGSCALAQSPCFGLAQERDAVSAGKAESYILHEYLEDVNEPIYFRDFAGPIAAVFISRRRCKTA